MQKKEQEKEQTLVMDFIKILFVMYFITCILLLLLAFVLYKAQPGEMVSKVWLIAVYIISGLAGGFLIGKRTKSRKFLWGCLMGMLYFAILFAVSLLLYKGLAGDWMHLGTTFVLCVASGTVESGDGKLSEMWLAYRVGIAHIKKLCLLFANTL